ncbi:hypothetical protein D779_1991 [Imhoffiella purpurea]|uniref:Uncharacterized protein n=1 Tax=Imhoffiella purpurea TaxID=1249627 RepID=W9VD79_9GAMM|nr:hypothetical protein D779_1991 [Imhoffiella purpurea]
MVAHRAARPEGAKPSGTHVEGSETKWSDLDPNQSLYSI